MKKAWRIVLLAVLVTAYAAGASAIGIGPGNEAGEVRLIQEALLALDFYYGDVTGHYGERTQRGVRMFQEEYGLEATGVADDATRTRLYQVAGVKAPPMSETLLEMNVTLRRGDSGSEVAWLQEGLAALGYYQGEITGSYGMLTHEAVRLFQRGHDLSSDGVAGRNTIRAIAQAIKEKEQADQTASAPEGGQKETGGAEATLDPELITTLTLGVQNSAVRQLQEDLTELGFYTGTVTGNFGNLTKEAVRLFQRANDIPSDGVAGPITLAEIAEKMEDLRQAQQQATASPEPTATPDPYNGLVEYITPEPEAAPIIGVNSSVGFLSIERELKLYDNSQDVRQLQLALNSLGYYSGAASGYLDLATKAAVMGYQAAKELSVTGTADRVTIITINDDIFRRVAGAVD